MRKRSLSIFVLAITLLFSAWSNVIAAAFCPRYVTRVGYIKHSGPQTKRVVDKSSCHHHEMAGMTMDDTQMGMDMPAEAETVSDLKTNADSTGKASQIELTSDSLSNEMSFDFPVDPCAHCWSHSQPKSGAVAATVLNPAKEVVETDAPLNVALALPSFLPGPITASEHGPPGNSFPRHVLINVFRI